MRLTPGEVLDRDSSPDFFAFMHTFKDTPQITPFMEKMRQAVMMSGYKYGAVKDKGPEHYSFLMELEEKALLKDGNHEHLVNIANYSMFLYMTDEPKIEYVENAVKAAKQWNEAPHIGTDSDKSVARRIKPASVSSFLHKDLLDSPYDFYNPYREDGFTTQW